MAGAYATIAAHGRYCAPIAITQVTKQDGSNIAVPQPHCNQVLPPALADTIATILHGVLTQPGATASGVGEPGRPAAAKTGTSENSKASNFAGFVPQMAAFVWVGYPDAPNRSLNGQTIGGVHYGEVFGATIAGPIWRDTFELALQGRPVIPLPHHLASLYLHGVTKTVPDVSGLGVHDAEQVLQSVGFHTTVGSQIDSLFPAGTVAATNPGAGSKVPPDTTITIYVSTGKAPKPTPTPKPTGPGNGGGGGPPPPSPTPSSTCTKPHGHCPG
jgi:membrane peptidoglycan carboxypeptidase